MIRNIPLERIKLDPLAQPRDHINADKVGEYAEAMMLGDTFPPLVVFQEGDDYWLADGFHRLHAALGCEFPNYPCEIHRGCLRDAILYSVGANAQHGYPRSNQDKRRSVRRLLNDPEWQRWSDREIARQCRVDHRFVGKLRGEMDTGDIPSMDRTFVHPKTGEPTTMATAGINAGRQEQPLLSPHVALPLKSQDDVDREEITAFRDEFASNAYIANRLWDAERIVQGLPAPNDAADKFPEVLLHSFSPDRARRISDWFDAFARAFDARKETRNVAAE